ncbi:MAG: ABC transporter ATP-binding protein [Fibrobacterota bacterium]
MIHIDNITFSYGRKPFIQGLSLRVREGELHGILGPNGAGKSTLLRLMGGLLAAQSGRVQVNNVEIGRLSPLDRAKLLAFVFQENYTGFPFTVEQMVLLGRHPHQDAVLFDTEADKKAAAGALELLGMTGFEQRLFRTLSGGEKQRVAIAAAIAQSTPVILFDEPTAFTDLRYQSEIYRLIHRIARTQNLTTVVITHDVNLASLYCDTLSVLRRGEILATGTPNDILTEALLSEAYATKVKIIRHPEENVPLVVPVLR